MTHVFYTLHTWTPLTDSCYGETGIGLFTGNFQYWNNTINQSALISITEPNNHKIYCIPLHDHYRYQIEMLHAFYCIIIKGGLN